MTQTSTITVNSENISIPNIVFSEQLPSGANGIVFKGFDTLLDRDVVVKFWVAKEGDKRDKAIQALAEAQKLAKLDHENIVKVYTPGIINDIFYLIMEYIEGKTLRETLNNNITIQSRKTYWGNIFGAMQYAHKKNIFHGDLHDRNILITAGGPKLIDFGTSAFCKSKDQSKQRESRLIISLSKQLIPEMNGKFEADFTELENYPEIVLYLCNLRIKLHSDLERLIYSMANFGNDDYTLRSEVGTIAYDIRNLPFFNMNEFLQLFTEYNVPEYYIKFFLNECISDIELSLSSEDSIDVHFDQQLTIECYLNKLSILQNESRKQLFLQLSKGYDALWKHVHG
jgi:serine/threonine protein kinase